MNPKYQGIYLYYKPMNKQISKDNSNEELIKLRTALSRYKTSNGLVKYQNIEMEKRNKYIVDMLRDKERGYSMIFDYYNDNKISYKFTKLSIIKDYTNQKGKVSKAHYNGKQYIGSTNKLGTKPILIDDWRIPTCIGEVVEVICK